MSLSNLFYISIIVSVLIQESLCACSTNTSSVSDGCFMGECIENQCSCFKGWGGPQCDTCFGRVYLNESSGFIYDGLTNYSHLSKCSWLIKPTQNHSTLRLRFNEFATECGWDHLYVYDGDSAFAPLIGAFNGLIFSTVLGHSDNLHPEVVARSGSAFLHFSSDQAFSMTGFNISYSIDECEYNCFQQGTCNDGSCVCADNSTGRQCNLCECSSDNVVCSDGSCPADIELDTRWSVVEFESPGRASYSLSSYNSNLWIYGGLTYDRTGADLLEFNTSTGGFEARESMDGRQPTSRYEHTAVVWNEGLLVFGGKLLETERAVDEVWHFDFLQTSWSRVNYTSDFGDSSTDGSNWQLRLAGHCAELVRFNNGSQLMVVLFGYHPSMGFSPFVYEYNPVTLEWRHPLTNGAIIRGLFGHTSVYDPTSGLIFIHGGMQLGTPSNNYNSRQTDETVSYDPDTRIFAMLASSGRATYLHSAVMHNGVMLVYGGSAQTNSTTHEQCYTSDLLAYNVGSDRWYTLPSPPQSVQGSRYGHQAAVVGGDRLYVISGFDSTMIRNVLIYQLPSCADLDEQLCESSILESVVCQWSGSQCVEAASLQPFTDDEREAFCLGLSGLPCTTCRSTGHDCQYCGSGCSASTAAGCNNTCPDTRQTYCENLFGCQLCESVPGCEWSGAACGLSSGPRNSSACNANTTCDTATSCGNCNNRPNCMWCQNVEKCIATNSYVLQFPYGQCVEWVRTRACPAYRCSAHQTCTACQNHTQCGWCDDGSLTGRGTCVEGGGSGQRNTTSGGEVCPSQNWFFATCPSCQCNGHSLCDANFNCVDCDDNTTGQQCERCDDGFYGNPLNGGNCSECQCGGKAENCDHSTGFCFCSTKGEIGMTCEECDTSAGYYGNATRNGTCFYTIQENYIFTFTLTPPGDEHVTAINFQNRPGSSDDVDLSLTSSDPCTVRLTVLANQTGLEMLVLYVHNTTSLAYTFETDLYKFGESNVTIRIYVSNFTVPFEVKVSLLQYNNALLRLLLIIFSTLLAALILGAVIWKIKLMWDNYRMRANRAIQMKEMAARPFAGVSLHCDDIYRSTKALLSPDAYEVSSNSPDVFCAETCGTGNAAVASVFLWLPSNVPAEQENRNAINNLSELYLSPPPGQSALAIGTVLLKQSKSQRERPSKTGQTSVNV